MGWTLSCYLGANWVLICMRSHLCSLLYEPGPNCTFAHPLYLCYSVSVLLFLFCIYVCTFSAIRELFVSPIHLKFAS